MRILAISTDYPPKRGGIASLSWSLIRSLHQQGHQVRVVATTNDFFASREFDRQQPFSTIRLPDWPPLREIALFFVVAYQLKLFRPEAIWSAVWFPAGVIVSFLCDKMTVQSISAYGTEILPFYDGWKQRLKARLGFLRQRVFDLSDLIFPLSRYTQRRLVEVGADPGKMLILPGGVSEKWFLVGRRETEQPRLLTVARLDEHKGHDMVIRALPQILRRFPETEYLMIGPGQEEWPRLEVLAREMGVLDKVSYRGLVSEEELMDAYGTATLFLMISREIPGQLVEGFGLTFLEAAAAGLCAVGGLSGGIPDAVEDGVTGRLVDPESPAALAEVICELLDNPEYRRRLGEQGRQRARDQFTWETIAARMSGAIEQALMEKLSCQRD